MTPFRAEIEQMPQVLEHLASWYRGEGRRLLVDAGARLRGAREAVFTGMGTSCFTPEAVFPRLGRSGLACRAVDAGEWLHYGAAVSTPGAVTVITSQSGESVEARRLLEQRIVSPGYIAITNNLESSLARGAGLTLPLLAGEEASISNKTYANTLGLLHLVAAAREGDQALAGAYLDIEQAAHALREADTGALVAAAARLAPAGGFAFVGRGPAWVAARQCALTFMEGTRCLASAFTGGGFNHGPLEVLEPGVRLVILEADGRTRALTRSLATRAASLGAEVVLISAVRGEAVEGVIEVPVPRPAAPRAAAPRPDGSPADREELFPLLASRVQNLLLHHVAMMRGHEAGVFRHGGKVTTHE